MSLHILSILPSLCILSSLSIYIYNYIIYSIRSIYSYLFISIQIYIFISIHIYSYLFISILFYSILSVLSILFIIYSILSTPVLSILFFSICSIWIKYSAHSIHSVYICPVPSCPVLFCSVPFMPFHCTPFQSIVFDSICFGLIRFYLAFSSFSSCLPTYLYSLLALFSLSLSLSLTVNVAPSPATPTISPQSGVLRIPGKKAQHAAEHEHMQWSAMVKHVQMYHVKCNCASFCNTMQHEM